MKPMKKSSILALATAMILVASAFVSLNAKEGATGEDTSKDKGKSVGWYVANIKEAKAQNKQCYENPGLQSSAECVNSLHALQISFVGGN